MQLSLLYQLLGIMSRSQKMLFKDMGKSVKECLLFHEPVWRMSTELQKTTLISLPFHRATKEARLCTWGQLVYFSEIPVVSLGYGSSLLVCQVLPGKTKYLVNREPAGHPIARDVWAFQILPFCVIHCYFHPAGLPNNLNSMTSRAAGVLARSVLQK